MIKFRKDILHQHQDYAPNCGPIALRCVFDEPIERLEKLVKCKSAGTSTMNVLLGLRSEGVVCNLVNLRDDHTNHLWWLEICSYRWPIYVGCNFINQGARGRPSHGHHAVLFANGLCYDGHNHREEPLAAIVLKFNKTFIINSIVIIEHELRDWKRNMEMA